MTAALKLAAPIAPTLKVELKAVDLAEAMRVAALFASTDKTYPMLCAIRLEGDGTTLTTLSTNRHVAGLYTTTYEGDPFEATLALSDVKLLLAHLKGQAHYVPAELTVHDGRLTVRHYDGEMTVRLSDHDFPKLRSLVPDRQRVGPVQQIAFDPRYLALFAKVGEKTDPMRCYFVSEVKPVRIEVGESFVGIIMPMRIADKK